MSNSLLSAQISNLSVVLLEETISKDDLSCCCNSFPINPKQIFPLFRFVCILSLAPVLWILDKNNTFMWSRVVWIIKSVSLLLSGLIHQLLIINKPIVLHQRQHSFFSEATERLFCGFLRLSIYIPHLCCRKTWLKPQFWPEQFLFSMYFVRNGYFCHQETFSHFHCIFLAWLSLHKFSKKEALPLSVLRSKVDFFQKLRGLCLESGSVFGSARSFIRTQQRAGLKLWCRGLLLKVQSCVCAWGWWRQRQTTCVMRIWPKKSESILFVCVWTRHTNIKSERERERERKRERPFNGVLLPGLEEVSWSDQVRSTKVWVVTAQNRTILGSRLCLWRTWPQVYNVQKVFDLQAYWRTREQCEMRCLCVKQKSLFQR